MRCKVCNHNKKSKDVDGHRICQECGYPCVPLTAQALKRYRNTWRKKVDDQINGHKRGTWADQSDEMVYFDENTLRIQREEAFA